MALVMWRGDVHFVVLDQIRTVDQERLLKRLGELAPDALDDVMRGLQEMFAE